MADPRKKLVLLDGHSLAYRAFFAMANTPLSVTHADGNVEPTGATYAFTNMVLKIFKDLQPDFAAVAFDIGKTFRDDLFAEYKGTREKMPDDLAKQLPRIQQMVTALGMPSFSKDGFEADDVIGTLARRASGEGKQVIIVTGDRDAFQLINPLVTVMTSGRSFDDVQMYDEARVLERFGVRPDQLIDYKALIGDTSDNVPGVRGIGEKTAAKLLQEHSTLDKVYAALPALSTKKVKSSLEEDKANAYLSQKLVTIRTDVPLDVDWDACRAQLNGAKVLPLLRELRMESLIKRLPAEAGVEVAEAPKQAALIESSHTPQNVPALSAATAQNTTVNIVASDADYKAMLKVLNAAGVISFDTETTGTDPFIDELVGLSFCCIEGEGWYLPCAHHRDVQTTKEQTDLFGGTAHSISTDTWTMDPTSAKFEPVMRAMQRDKVELVAHNSKFDLQMLQQLGYEFNKPVFDTMLAQFVAEPGSALGLKSLAAQYLGWSMTEITELIGTGKKQISMREVPIDKAAPYAVADADATLRIAQLLKSKLRSLGQEDLLRKVEFPLVHVLMNMEMSGVCVNTKHLGALSVEIEERLRQVEKEIFDLAKTTFNVNSPQQMSDVLFGNLQLPTETTSKTSTKSKSGGTVYSTAADVLESLRGKHPIIEPILAHRELSKLKGTYVDALPALINPKTNCIHTDFNQAGAVTGRVSSSNPNLQNIPIKTEEGRRVRQAFVAHTGNTLISADYSQVELRILAHLADDPTMKEAFARGEDIHASTAAAIYDVSIDKVNAMQRNFAKRINFGIAYGMGAFALSQNTGMSQAEAKDFIAKYFARFEKVKLWLDETKRKAAEVGYVETVLGRRRYFPELRAGAGTGEMLKRRAEREAINHPVQGSAADIMKIAMINIHRTLKAKPYRCAMTLQVHDELVFDCPKNEIDEVSTMVKREMEAAYDLSVKLRADVKTGKNWDEA